jgi:hypothetical protein
MSLCNEKSALPSDTDPFGAFIARDVGQPTGIGPSRLLEISDR